MIRSMFLLILVVGIGRSEDRLSKLAQAGEIQEDAPVKASSATVIHAAPATVWSLLTGVNDWPKWQRDITKAKIDGPLACGTRFSWTSGTRIQSQIVLIRPFEELAWTGRAYQASAIHVWRLESLPGGETRVQTSESLDGFLLRLFYSSDALEKSQQHWLSDLKAAAER